MIQVLKVLKILYCLKQLPNTFFDTIKAGLIKQNFVQLEVDKFLFMKGDSTCLVYVDDTILVGLNLEKLNKEITGLGVSNKNQNCSFQLKNEGQVGYFVGIRIEKLGERKFHLIKTEFINTILKVANMEDYNPFTTPSSTVPLATDADCDIFQESLEYATVVGMLMYPISTLYT